MRLIVAALVMITLSAGIAPFAQEKPPASSTVPTAGARLEFLDEVSYYEQRFIRLAEAIPAEKYSWRPAEGVRSVGEVYMHVVSGNYGFARMIGTPVPAGVDTKAMMAFSSDKTKVVQALKDSFAHFRNAVLAIRDSELEKEIKTPRGQSTIRGAFFLITGHYGEHLGQAIAYARAVGVVPPWTEERQRREAEKSKPSSLRSPSKEPCMEKVTGTGGVFFRASNPRTLAEWYRVNLGIDRVPNDYDDAPWQQQAVPTAFSPFKEDTNYFGNWPLCAPS